MSRVVQFSKAFAGDDRGVTAIEYGMIAALVFLAIITGVGTLGETVAGLFELVAAGFAS